MGISNRCVGGLVASVAVAALVGCGSGSSTSGKATLPSAESAVTSPYSLKIFADDGKARRLIKVFPAEVAPSVRAAQRSSGSAHVLSAGAHLLDDPPVSAVPDGGDPNIVEFVPASTDDLLVAAAAECGMIGDPTNAISQNLVFTSDPGLQTIVQQEANGQRITAVLPIPPFSASSGYYIFPIFPTTCDQVLEQEETLVCMADKLAELADSVGPVEWHGVRFTSLACTAGEQTGTPGIPCLPITPDLPPLTWIIPPPAENEKFIVRDLAIDVLAHLPMLDAYRGVDRPDVGNAPLFTATCSTLY